MLLSPFSLTWGEPFHISHTTPHTMQALDLGVPPVLLEDAMAVGKQLVNQQFSPQMRKWATCVRAGWSILSAILHQVGR